MFKQATGSDPNLTKERMTQDAMMIFNELPESELDLSSASQKEIKYFDDYHDPDFQGVFNQLKRLCKRERMLVTLYENRINEIEEDKNQMEQTLADFMHKSSVPLLTNSAIEDSATLKDI